MKTSRMHCALCIIMINYCLVELSHAGTIYVVNQGTSSIGAETVYPTISGVFPNGDSLLLKINLSVATNIQGIEFRLTCESSANCGYGNIANMGSAYSISDGDVDPSAIAIRTFETSPNNTVNQAGLFAFSPSLQLGQTTSTLGLTFSEGLINIDNYSYSAQFRYFDDIQTPSNYPFTSWSTERAATFHDLIGQGTGGDVCYEFNFFQDLKLRCYSTLAGEYADDYLDRIAAAINTDSELQQLNVSAGAVGNQITFFTDVTVEQLIADAGFSAVPIPPAFWLFCSGLGGLFGFMRIKKTA